LFVECATTQSAFNARLDFGHTFRVLRISVPQGDLVVVVLESQDKTKHFVTGNLVKLLANHGKEKLFPILRRVGLRKFNRPTAAVLTVVILPQGFDSLDKL
jgi:hypothetical protein